MSIWFHFVNYSPVCFSLFGYNCRLQFLALCWAMRLSLVGFVSLVQCLAVFCFIKGSWGGGGDVNFTP